MQQILPDLYRFTGLQVGCAYLIEDLDGLTLIDTGLPSAAAQIAQQLGARLQQVKRILITHPHSDHIGALPRLHELTGAPVWAGGPDRAVIEGREPVAAFRGRRLLPGTPVARDLADGEVLPEVMGGLQVVATPGHSAGHLCFWQPERRVLFCGDLIMRLPLLGLRPPFASATLDMAANWRGVRRVAALKPAVVCFGHGAPLARNAAEALAAFAARAPG
jgi:glyoxylase-like metal-dependent hydrolase (beta-lactamase superfamily II)